MITEAKRLVVGGVDGTRTHYLFVANEALSLMSYNPKGPKAGFRIPAPSRAQDSLSRPPAQQITF